MKTIYNKNGKINHGKAKIKKNIENFKCDFLEISNRT
jgi:hypothetical protein